MASLLTDARTHRYGLSRAVRPAVPGWQAQLRCLEDGPRRFTELRVPLRRVTPKVLTQSLRGLERDGLVSRTVHNAPELGVEDARTPLGRSMLEPLAAACAWAAEHWDELLDAREAYKSP